MQDENIQNILKKRNLILSESVRVTINTGSDKIIKENPSYVSTQEQKGN